MSKQRFDDDCPGCRPVVIDVATGKPDPSAMAVMDSVWLQTTAVERAAFHRFTCLNARDREAVAVMQSISDRFQTAMKARGS